MVLARFAGVLITPGPSPPSLEATPTPRWCWCWSCPQLPWWASASMAWSWCPAHISSSSASLLLLLFLQLTACSCFSSLVPPFSIFIFSSRYMSSHTHGLLAHSMHHLFASCSKSIIISSSSRVFTMAISSSASASPLAFSGVFSGV